MVKAGKHRSLISTVHKIRSMKLGSNSLELTSMQWLKLRRKLTILRIMSGKPRSLGVFYRHKKVSSTSHNKNTIC